MRHADGDARRALNATEALHRDVTRTRRGAEPEPVTAAHVSAVLERRIAQYDKSGEQHYNVISALHKAVRGSDVEGALYWFARMVEGGEDMLYIARRVVRMATEDIGLADPRALSITLAAKDAYDFLGSPEGELAIAEAIVYLATAPKSNKVYAAWGAAQQAARDYPAEPVPLHIRNAPTGLMKDLGYGGGYRYDHAEGRPRRRPGVPARRAARREVVRADRLGLREDARRAPRVVGEAEGERSIWRRGVNERLTARSSPALGGSAHLQHAALASAADPSQAVCLPAWSTANDAQSASFS